MLDRSELEFSNLQQLRSFVKETLCQPDRLDANQVRFYESPVKGKKGTYQGIAFFVHGPRLLQTTSIWLANENRILFYSSTGIRFLEVFLTSSPVEKHHLKEYFEKSDLAVAS